MSEAQTHTGGCHCGAVRYEVAIDLTKPAITCNCSICQKTGTMLAFVPAPSFTLRSGEDSLTEYRFNRQVVAHLFCKVCGVRSFARGTMPDGSATVAVNVRSLDDLDLASVPTKHYDGRSI